MLLEHTEVLLNKPSREPQGRAGVAPAWAPGFTILEPGAIARHVVGVASPGAGAYDRRPVNGPAEDAVGLGKFAHPARVLATGKTRPKIVP